eukprot:1959488-Amphidinium_carterae.1
MMLMQKPGLIVIGWTFGCVFVAVLFDAAPVVLRSGYVDYYSLKCSMRALGFPVRKADVLEAFLMMKFHACIKLHCCCISMICFNVWFQN